VTQAADPAVDAGQRIADACHVPWAEAWDALDERLGRVLLRQLRAGLERHRAAIQAAGLDGEAPSEWTERSDRLLEYRRAIGSLLEPLADAFHEEGPATVIVAEFDGALERANAGARALPETVPAPWTEEALTPHPTDALGRRLGKVVARAVSGARKTGEERPLPLRGVAVQHLGQDVAEAEGEAVVEAMIEWARWGRRLERAWVEWADAALPALVQAEMPDAEDVADLWTAVREGATALHERLEALAGESPHADAEAAGRSMLGACRGALAADLAVAGSFLLPGRSGHPARLGHVARVAPALRSWDRDVGARMRLYTSLLGILAGATAIQRRLVHRCREASFSRVDDLLAVAKELRSLAPTLRAREAGSTLRDRIATLDARVPPVLAPSFDVIPAPGHVAAAVSEVADSAVEALLAVIRQAPPSLALHDRAAEPPAKSRAVETRSVPLQELARQAFDALRIERIRSSTEGLVTAIAGVRSDLEGLPEVFSFARDEALREIESKEPDSESDATQLLEGAVERMASSLETRVEDLEKAIQGAQARLASEITEGSSALLGRVGAGRMQAQLLAARSRAADLVAWVTGRWGPALRRALAWSRRTWRRIVELAKRVLSRGSAALGREPAVQAVSTRTIQSLAEVQELVEGLPLVYQRLFTLEPIADPALLAGRENELEAAMERWRRWHRDEGVPLLVRGRQRSGITSFLRVLSSHIQGEGHRVAFVSLDERLSTEAPLARLFTKALGIAPVSTLDELARAIFAVDSSELPGAIAIDNLEHVYMRVPKGTDLVERVLTLMAETEPRIFWMGGITSSAWQLVSAAEATAVSQVDVMELPPIDAESVRAAILARHRRSGLDVHYEESITAAARLRRRLRRMRDGKGMKKLLEDEYFEQLRRASGGYLGLALFLWLQSARFDSDEGVVMSLPTRPDFSVLDQLSLTQNFTLKAFLEHRTLSLAEHDAVFRLPRHESYQILESLRNRQLIEQVVLERDPGTEQSDIDLDRRYRVRPLLTGAVIAHLQGRNIVH